MPRIRWIRHSWKGRAGLGVAVLALLATLAVAQAEPIQQFSFQLVNLKPGGRFTFVFNARSFDTTGAVPPPLTENYIRFPAGATLRKEFRNKRYYCNGEQLRTDLDDRGTGQDFATRVANLKPFIRSLSKSKDRGDRKALANALVCDHARIGGGTANVDARNLVAVLDQLIPSHFSIFMTKPAHGAVGGFVVLGSADQSNALVRKYAIIGDVHVALHGNFYNDPTGPYGYKLELPVGPINNVNVSVAELHVKTSGLTLAKGTCLATSRSGRCTRKQKKTLFWFTIPKCPASGQFSILSQFSYAPPTPSVTQVTSIPCPKFIP
jgi:hypothetical protein